MTAVASTRGLFARLLRTLEVTTVCDVGSMDGADAQVFRRRLPHANILALEPNPRNFELMRKDERLRASGIQVLPFAASDEEAEAPFFIVKLNAEKDDRFRRGMSSLHRRADHSLLAAVVAVRAVRLDRLLTAEQLADGAIAFWIDAEGKAYEVIRGAAGVLGNTRMLHVEVETTPCIGVHQHLFPDVCRCLEQAGFRLLATDKPVEHVQFNALFVRADVLRDRAIRIRAWLALAWLRRSVKRVALACVPSRVRKRYGLWLY
jgi:FkbM family methyltransferase